MHSVRSLDQILTAARGRPALASARGPMASTGRPAAKITECQHAPTSVDRRAGGPSSSARRSASSPAATPAAVPPTRRRRSCRRRSGDCRTVAVVVSAPVSAPEPTAVSSAAPSAPSTAGDHHHDGRPGCAGGVLAADRDELGFVAGGATVFGEGKAAEPQETPVRRAHGVHRGRPTKGADATRAGQRVGRRRGVRRRQGAGRRTGDVGGVGDRAFSSTLASIYAVAGGHTLFVQFGTSTRTTPPTSPSPRTSPSSPRSRL